MDHNRNERRAIIRAFLESSQKLNEAAKEVMEKKYTVEKAALIYKVAYKDLCLKIENVQYKNMFNRDRSQCEQAAKEEKSQILDEAAKQVMEKKCTQEEAASRYKVDYIDLLVKLMYIQNENKLNRDGSQYEQAVNEAAGNEKEEDLPVKHKNVNFPKRSIFTYIEEKSLLEDLSLWSSFEDLNGNCICQICALEQLSIFAYDKILDRKLKPAIWVRHKQANHEWLKEFEMRHSDTISTTYSSYMSCLHEKTEHQ